MVTCQNCCSPSSSSYVGVCHETSDTIEDWPRDSLLKYNVYFLFVQEVFRHRYPWLRGQAINVEGCDFVTVKHREECQVGVSHLVRSGTLNSRSTPPTHRGASLPV